VWAAVLLVPLPAPRWLLVMLVIVIGTGGPGSMIGFDFARTPWVRAAERGAVAPVCLLEPENLAVLETIVAALDARERDWAAYHSATVAFHLRNAAAWGDRATGTDLAAQIDPEFVPGALVRS